MILNDILLKIAKSSDNRKSDFKLEKHEVGKTTNDKEHSSLNKRLIFTLHVTNEIKIKVYLVDGTYVRKTYDDSFTGGTNWEADEYCTKNEIWLEAMEPGNLVHEFVESTIIGLLKKYKTIKDPVKLYDFAHMHTSYIESFIRELYETMGYKKVVTEFQK